MATTLLNAAEQLHHRRECRRSLVAWSRHNGFEPAAHHMVLIDALERAARREIKRLAIFLPPGSAKSTYASVLAPPWMLCNAPDSCLIAASHTADLAEHFGRRIRNIIASEGNILGYHLRSDSKAAGKWETSNGCQYYAAGVGGSITGRRADIAIIDDPVKGAEDADSDLSRERNWQWYLFDLKTRLKPTAVIILIQTRWHEDDLAGRILEHEGAEWEVISIPMEARQDDPIGRKAGEMLWPDYFTPEMVTTAKRDPRLWSALYQQSPSPEEGNYFKREWFTNNFYHSLDEIPEHIRVYGAADWAVGTRQENDLNCFGTVGVDSNDDIWVFPDIWWKKGDTGESVEAFLALLKRRLPLVTWSESGHISKAVGPFLRQRMKEERVYCYIDEVVPSRDKPTRARAIQGRASMHKVHLPAPTLCSWVSDAMHELLTFPVGKHDDFVDWLAHIGMGVDRMIGATVPIVHHMPGRLTLDWLKKSAHRNKIYDLIRKDDV